MDAVYKLRWTSSRAAAVRRVAIGLALGGVGSAVLHRLSRAMYLSRLRQRALAASALPLGLEKAEVTSEDQSSSSSSSIARVAVDGRFGQRLAAILRICMPSLFCKETGLVLLQGMLLLSRTVLSDSIARLEGVCGEKVTSQDWTGFRAVIAKFATVSVPASIVNAALKALQIYIQLAFRKRLTSYLHKLYMENRAYYSAAVLGGISHADQRLTDDVEKFCEAVAELYSRTFKPLLDVSLFTYSLSKIIGLRGQLFLHGYFVVIGILLKAVSPPLALMTAQYGTLNGSFRSAHSRIAANAEEIAFNDPPAGRTEMQALNSKLERMVEHSQLTAFQRFLQSSLDGYCTKYTASIIGLVIFALPLYLSPASQGELSSVIAGKYINAMRLMMQSSSAMGQLVLVYKRVSTLAGHTARVSELLEQVRELGQPNGRLNAFQRVQNRVAQSSMANGTSTQGSVVANGPNSWENLPHCSDVRPADIAAMKHGSSLKLEKVTLWAPDGSLLVQDISIEVPPGRSVIIEGPNGSGKSSILRMLAGLWPLQSGIVTLPNRSSMFFLSQRPYVFAGGSLAMQLMYPNLPGVVVGETVCFDEDRALKCLQDVELPHLVSRCGGFDGMLQWDEVLSGGERNRLAVARLLYHRPTFAILDEVRFTYSSRLAAASFMPSLVRFVSVIVAQQVQIFAFVQADANFWECISVYLTMWQHVFPPCLFPVLIRIWTRFCVVSEK